MPFDPDRHHRRSTRYRGYDYGADGWGTCGQWCHRIITGREYRGGCMERDSGPFPRRANRRVRGHAGSCPRNHRDRSPNPTRAPRRWNPRGATTRGWNHRGAKTAPLRGRSGRVGRGRIFTWAGLSRGSNTNPPNGSIDYAARRGRVFGNGISMTESFATRRRCTGFANTSGRVRLIGSGIDDAAHPYRCCPTRDIVS